MASCGGRYVPLPVGLFEQGVDDFGPEVDAGRVAAVGSRGVAEERLAEVVLLAPYLGDPVPERDAMRVQPVAGGDQPQIVESPRHQAGVEHALGVEHRLARVGATFLEPPADLAKPLVLGGCVAASQVFHDLHGRKRRANVGTSLEQFAGAVDRLVGRPDARQPGHRQQ